VNQEGRVQFAASVYRGGIPISQTGAGRHPPRVFNPDIPGGEPEPAWQITARLANAMSMPGGESLPLSRSELWKWMAETYPAFSDVQLAGDYPDGVRVNLKEKEEPFSSGKQTRFGKMGREDDEKLELLVVDWTFGTEELSAYSKLIQQVEKQPSVFMNPKDASRIGLQDGQRTTLPLDRDRLEVELRIVDNMASGVIVMPRHRRLAWQKIEKWPTKVAAEQIGK